MRYSQEQIFEALQVVKITGSPYEAVQTLGYPSIPMIYHWCKKYLESDTYSPHKGWKKASVAQKLVAIERCTVGRESVKSVSEQMGYSQVTIYRWLNEYHRKGYSDNMKESKSVDPKDIQSAPDIEALKEQMLDMQMEIDILKETIKVLKKDPGVDWKTLRNREKAAIIGALRNNYSLPKLCKKLNIPRSSYYYHEAHPWKINEPSQELRERIIRLFHENRDAYGYRKIRLCLLKEGIVVSEKIIRQIMRQEGLLVKQRRKKKYNSYKGEITPAVENLVNRNFHSEKPNEKWLTDITEFTIKDGKVYLSPIIDCFDGMPVSWTIGTAPNTELTNTMLRQVIATLKPNEKPMVHSEQGCHYRWP